MNINRKKLDKFRIGSFLAYIIFIVILSPNLFAEDAVGRFLAIPNYKSTEGVILFQNASAGTNTEFVATKFLWSKGDLVCEQFSKILGTNILLAALGTYKGTNWEYGNGIFTVDGEPGQDLSHLYSALHGLTRMALR